MLKQLHRDFLYPFLGSTARTTIRNSSNFWETDPMAAKQPVQPPFQTLLFWGFSLEHRLLDFCQQIWLRSPEKQSRNSQRVEPSELHESSTLIPTNVRNQIDCEKNTELLRQVNQKPMDSLWQCDLASTMDCLTRREFQLQTAQFWFGLPGFSRVRASVKLGGGAS